MSADRGRQHGDGFQLRLVMRGKPTLANLRSRIMRRRVATQDVRANAPVTRFRVLADSEPSPSSNEHAIQRDPNEVIIDL
jgi:hypothetical protein